MTTTKWTLIATALPLMVACEESSGQCVRGVSAPVPMATAIVSAPAPAPAPASASVAAATPPALASVSVPAPLASESAAAPPAPPPAAQPRTISGGLSSTPAAAAAFAVVYLQDAPVDPKRGMNATIDQRGMLFLPSTVAVTVGGSVKFFNSDPFPHNVFSPQGQKFNLGMLPPGGTRSVTFTQAGGYSLLCNVHPGMYGRLFVSPSSYFAVADAHGKYAIKDVPEGTYRVAVWATGKFVVEPQSVKLEGADATADFALHK